jgi:light-regulated signal transduction histidine kinase (bacteriophytochrome)
MKNLLTNAWTFTGRTESARISFSTYVENGNTVYQVKDNGSGFKMDYAEKLFEVFQRLHRKEDFEGIGVGLATVKRIIDRHGGSIWAEGKEGEGASFYFTLPAEHPMKQPG